MLNSSVIILLMLLALALLLLRLLGLKDLGELRLAHRLHLGPWLLALPRLRLFRLRLSRLVLSPSPRRFRWRRRPGL